MAGRGSFDGLPFIKDEAVEARYWGLWKEPYPIVRGVIVEIYPGHVDIDVSYTSHDVSFYPGKSQFWEGNICRVPLHHVRKRLGLLASLGACWQEDKQERERGGLAPPSHVTGKQTSAFGVSIV